MHARAYCLYPSTLPNAKGLSLHRLFTKHQLVCVAPRSRPVLHGSYQVSGASRFAIAVPKSSSASSAAPSNVDDLKAFWLNQGLAEYQAERLCGELARRSPPGCYSSPAWLSDRLGSLASVLPCPVPPLIYTDSELLDAEPAQVARCLVELTEALPGIDVIKVVSEQPKLLRTPDVGSRVKKVLTKLTQLYPYKVPNKRAEVLKVVEDYPQLLVRMEYYLDDKKIRNVRDLPVDLVNCIMRIYC